MDSFTIEESDMVFGPYNNRDVYHIEKSQAYKKLNCSGIRSVEFILIRQKQIMFIEAKSSTPNYKDISSSEEKMKRHEQFVEEVTEKFVHSIDIFFSAYAERLDNNDMSDNVIQSIRDSQDISLILVVKHGFVDSLVHYKEIIESKLADKRRIWKIRKINVIDESTARAKKLII